MVFCFLLMAMYFQIFILKMRGIKLSNQVYFKYKMNIYSLDQKVSFVLKSSELFRFITY